MWEQGGGSPLVACAHTLRVAVAILIAAFALAGFPSDAIAAEADTWNGSADISWYNADDPQTSYTIATAEQLAGLSQVVGKSNKWFDGVTLTLAADLDISGHEWQQAEYFAGTFDGNGHTIKGLTVTTDSNNYGSGLFGVLGWHGSDFVDCPAIVKNLKLTDVNISRTDKSRFRFGVVADIVADGSTIQNCSTSGMFQLTTSTTSTYVGGIVGFAEGEAHIIGCSSTMKLTSTETNCVDNEYMGGLVGFWNFGGSGEDPNERAELSNSYFTGSIDSKCYAAAVGGLFGMVSKSGVYPGKLSVKNCMVATDDLSVREGNLAASIGSAFEASTPTSWCYVISNALVKQSSALPAVYQVDPTASSSPISPLPLSKKEGMIVSDLSDAKAVEVLNSGTSGAGTWVAGAGSVGHPVLAWETDKQPANYSKVNGQIDRIPSEPELGNYTDDSVKAVLDAKNAVVEGLTSTQQDEVDKMAAALQSAIDGLVLKTYELAVMAPAFDAITYGDARPGSRPLIIANSGNSAATISSVSVSGDAFVLNKTDGTAVDASETDSSTYRIRPVSGLTAGTHEATVTVSYDNGATATATVSLTVNKAKGSLTVAPVTGKRYGDAPFKLEVTSVGDGSISFGSSDNKVATVDAKTGEVTIIGVGKVEIAVTLSDGANYTGTTASVAFEVGEATMEQPDPDQGDEEGVTKDPEPDQGKNNGTAVEESHDGALPRTGDSALMIPAALALAGCVILAAAGYLACKRR